VINDKTFILGWSNPLNPGSSACTDRDWEEQLAPSQNSINSTPLCLSNLTGKLPHKFPSKLSRCTIPHSVGHIVGLWYKQMSAEGLNRKFMGVRTTMAEA